ncbi:hypothetical protein A6M13_08115 [Caryophanon tenue]|uniref:Uncharacterized protein n=1 Tax=Caryophanon tenue TaxID=33978 RepID=A0A1C0YL66_9BACL|nr:hypothetical protein A6M13_08115 [Caryophanon tenue]
MSGRLSILVPLKEQATVRCVLQNNIIVGHPETGENLEAISFYYDDVKLSIGVTADFMQQEAQIVTNGIELTTTSPITFVVSWIQPVTGDNDLPTFFSVDLFYFVNNKNAMDTHKRTVSIAFFNI